MIKGHDVADIANCVVLCCVVSTRLVDMEQKILQAANVTSSDNPIDCTFFQRHATVISAHFASKSLNSGLSSSFLCRTSVLLWMKCPSAMKSFIMRFRCVLSTQAYAYTHTLYTVHTTQSVNTFRLSYARFSTKIYCT